MARGEGWMGGVKKMGWLEAAICCRSDNEQQWRKGWYGVVVFGTEARLEG